MAAITHPSLAKPQPLTMSVDVPLHVPTLTDRQYEVMKLIREGLTYREVAQRLGISEYTVKHHLTAVMRLLNVDSRTSAVVVAMRRGDLALLPAYDTQVDQFRVDWRAAVESGLIPEIPKGS